MINTFWKIIKSNFIFRVILLAELLILLWMSANCLRARCGYLFTTENLYAADAPYVSIITGEDGQAGYCLASEEEVEEESALYTEKFSLYPGAYRITVSYASQVNYMEEADIDVGLSYLNVLSGQQGYYCQFESMLLRDGTNCVEQTLQVTSPGKLGSIQLSLDFYGQGEVTVYSIELTEICAYRYLGFLGWFLIFAGFDVLFFLLFTGYRYQYARELGVLVLICLAGILPFLADFVFVGHDTGFHAYRIALLAEEISEGNYFPAIYSAALNGYGYAAPLFYNQLFLYIPALLYLCGFSLTFAYNFYLEIMTVAACLIMYYCALKIFRKRSTALLAAALYTLSAVRLTNILTRAAFGELTAQTFLPLVVLGFYNIYTAKKGEKITIDKYWPVIAGMTGIASSHVLSLFMSAMVIFVVCLVLWRKTWEAPRLFGLVKAAGLTLAVNLASIVPMVTSMGMDMNVSHVTNYIQTSGTYFLQLFNSIVNNYQRSDEGGTAADEMSLSIGFPVTLGLLLCLVCFYRYTKRDHKTDDREKTGFMGLCWGMTVLTLFLSSVYMFYDYLGEVLPENVYSMLTVYQFPWRWLTFATLFGVFCTAAAADREEASAIFFRMPTMFILSAALVINTGEIYADQLQTSETYRFADHLYDDKFWLSNSEYMLNGVYDGWLSYRRLIYEEDQLIVHGEYAYENGRWLLTVENLTDQVAGIHIPLQAYDHYAAYDAETGEMIGWVRGYSCLVYLSIPANYSGTVAVEYQLPLLWKCAITVSILVSLALIEYMLWMHRCFFLPGKRINEDKG
ncbi:MAG: hypothetical protein LUE16_10450 [Lachnospiraceae bacterium]|nr:hypothetical protein [Lachnospiraceae bacterium]